MYYFTKTMLKRAVFRTVGQFAGYNRKKQQTAALLSLSYRNRSQVRSKCPRLRVDIPHHIIKNFG